MSIPIALALFAGIACSGCSAAAQSTPNDPGLERKLFEQEEAWERLLQISDDEFLAFNDEKQSALQDGIADIMLDSSSDDPDEMRSIVAMYGLRRVSLRKSQQIPAFIAKWYNGLRGWQVDEVSNLHVLVKHAATGALSFSSPRYSARRGRQRAPSGVGDPPDRWHAATTYASVMPIDLASQLTAPIAPGLVAATTIEYDLRSRTIRVEVDGPRVDPPPAPELVGYVTYELGTGEQPSLDVEVPPSVAAGSPAIVKVATQVGPEASVLRNANGDPILVAHLVLIRLDRRPLLIPAPVPVQPVASSDSGARWNARFEIDLRATGDPLEPGTWHVFIDAGVDLLGPFPMEITE
jgi:hypothetical protein